MSNTSINLKDTIRGNAATATKFQTARTINGVSFDGSANINVHPLNLLTNPTSGTWYYSTFFSGQTNGSSYQARTNDGFRYYTLQGTTSAAGRSLLSLGNTVSTGTAGNKRGELRIYGEKNAYVDIYATAGSTNNRTLTLPDATGTVALISSNVASATKLKSIDDRDIKPSGTQKSGANVYFSSLGGLTGSANNSYVDLLVLNSYGDTSGGVVNALAFSKKLKSIYHYQAAQGATTWGTAHTIAYTSSTVECAKKLQTEVLYDKSSNLQSALWLSPTTQKSLSGLKNVTTYTGKVLRFHIYYAYNTSDSKGVGNIIDIPISSTTNNIALSKIMGFDGNGSFMIVMVGVADINTTTWKFSVESIKSFRNSDVMVEERSIYGNRIIIGKIEIMSI